MLKALTIKVHLHSILWLFIANCVGVLLAVLLLFPELNRPLAPFTYGRWMPLHLNLHLYGWMSIPLLGLLFAWYLEPTKLGTRLGNMLLLIWSAALAFGALSWLGGSSSGKLFLDWQDTAKSVFLAALIVWWGTLTVCYGMRLRRRGIAGEGGVGVVAGKAVLLTLLAAVPPAFTFALRRDVYPPINRLSSGATGASLLVSTLGILVVFWLLPLILRLPLRRAEAPWLLLAALVVHFGLWSFIDHGSSSHHDPMQIVSLATLIAWVPLLSWYYAQFAWPDSAKRWLLSFGWWGAVLVVTAVVMFLPGVLERVKFTNGLVAHVHLAMAGMTSSFLMVLLVVLGTPSGLGSVLSNRTAFVLWHAGLCIYLGSMLYVSSLESHHVDILYRTYAVRAVAYGSRLVGGVAMCSASLWWLLETLSFQTRQTRRATAANGKG
ncbi:MAG: hypothetical protein KDD69_03240 [Bdellovibrionales bacterium]|nr:hypothetical protein [Bdellovibrionales bacterium]